MPTDFDPFEALGIPSSGEIYSYDLVGLGGRPGNDFLSSADTRPSPDQGARSGTVTVKPYQPDLSITERGEVGASGPANQANISPDTNGSRSYGILGLNSATGSAADFASSYPGLGLTAKPGSAQFNEQWTRAARDNPQALYDAQVDWHARNIVVPMQQGLLASGVRPEIANDPRVLNYLADRRVQHGNVGWAEAMQLAQGARSPEEYIAAVSANDRANVGTYFRSYLPDHPNDVHGLQNRIALRERLSLDPTAYGNEFSLIEGDRSAAFAPAANAPRSHTA